MAEEIQLCKADGQEWGFRVTGGADFGTALTIIKIHKGSTSERAGLRVGDMIIKVNDQPLGHMTHFQATAAIAKAGNMCTATVIRGSLVQVPQIPIPVPEIVLQNGTDNAPLTTGVTGEQEELVLPSVLANMINTGIQEQPVDEEAALNQQNQDVDQEVADSWNFSLPQQLVVTLKSVTPTHLEGGRPGSPWEIIEERSTFIERPDAELEGEPTSKDAATTAGQQKTGVAGQAMRPEVIKTGQPTSVAAGEALRADVIKAGQQKAAAAGQAQPAADRTAAGEQQQSDAAQNKTEGGGSEEETKEHKEYTEEEIAEMMSGCAEVLVGKCIGVDFQKLPPDTDIMKSEVLHVLIEEKIHKPEKKLTTFQQRPSRPKPRPKGEPEVRPAPYLPLKYKGTPKKKEEEPTKDVSAELSGSSEATVGSEGVVEISQEATEVTEEIIEGEQTEEHKEIEEEMTEHENAESAENVDKPENQPENQDPITVVDPTDIESQLAEIQTQLAAIIQLPVEIQQHLTFIQTQLSKILELRAAAETAENPECAEEEPILEGEEHHEEPVAEHNAEGETEEGTVEGEDRVGGEEEGTQVTEQGPEPEAEPEVMPEPEPEPPKIKKDIQWKKEDEERKRNKPFFPLTPQPRPVQLPGRRHWFKPRDVYTEDFIAETISGKEEIITGTTIGVDFRKFQCSLDHLKNSSVYKMIHGDEAKRMPGVFASREEKVRSKEDYVSPYKPTETTFSLYKTKNILGL